MIEKLLGLVVALVIIIFFLAFVMQLLPFPFLNTKQPENNNNNVVRLDLSDNRSIYIVINNNINNTSVSIH